MAQSVSYQPVSAPSRDRANSLFAQTMGYVAGTAAVFALGAYLGRNLTGGAGIIAFIAAFACLIGTRFAARTPRQLTAGLLAAFGLLIGLALAPVLVAYASADPQALWQAGAASRAGHRCDRHAGGSGTPPLGRALPAGDLKPGVRARVQRDLVLLRQGQP